MSRHSYSYYASGYQNRTSLGLVSYFKKNPNNQKSGALYTNMNVSLTANPADLPEFRFNGNVKDDVRYVLKDKFWKRLFALYPFDRLPLKNRVYYKIVKFDSPFIMMMLAKLQQIL